MTLSREGESTLKSGTLKFGQVKWVVFMLTPCSGILELIRNVSWEWMSVSVCAYVHVHMCRLQTGIVFKKHKAEVGSWADFFCFWNVHVGNLTWSLEASGPTPVRSQIAFTKENFIHFLVFMGLPQWARPLLLVLREDFSAWPTVMLCNLPKNMVLIFAGLGLVIFMSLSFCFSAALFAT